MENTMSPEQVVDFWFDELEPQQWWVKDPSLDRMIGDRFGVTLAAAAKGELWAWRTTPVGRLAEIIALDQFSRNIHRDTAQAFANDAMALVLAQEAVAMRADAALALERRTFLYMPYMHSESPAIHEQAVVLFSAPGLELNLEFEYKHKVIIDRFGRYPHRNAILAREATSEELAFLLEPNSSF
jgi:uncharacterized protein (DUF924 family)